MLDRFRDWCERTPARRTYEFYRENHQRFAKRITRQLTVADPKPFQGTHALADFPRWGNNTKHDFIGSVKRALNWAADEELIERYPLAWIKKPAREAREMAVSPGECAVVLQAVEEPGFRDLIQMAWETGARMQKFRQLESRFVDLASWPIVFCRTRPRGRSTTASSTSPTVPARSSRGWSSTGRPAPSCATRKATYARITITMSASSVPRRD